MSTPNPPSTRALEEARVRLDRELSRNPEDPKLLLLRGRADERLEQHAEAAGFFKRAARVFRQLGERGNEASAVLEAAVALGRAAALTDSRMLFLRAISTFEELGDTPAAARARAAYARIQLETEQLDDAREQLELALGPLEAARDWETLGWANERLVDIARARGDSTVALEHARSAVECAAQAKDRPKFGTGLARVAALHHEAGNWGKARQYGERAVAYLREAEAWVDLLRNYEMLVEGARAEGDGERAERLLDDGIRVADDARKPMYQGRLRARLGELLLERGDAEGALGVLLTAVAQLHAAGDLRTSAPAHEALGRAHWRTGDVGRAVRSLERSAWMYRQLGDEQRASEVAALGAQAMAGDWEG